MKIHTLDLKFLELEHAIAVFVIETAAGPVMVECGPASTLPHLSSILQKNGWKIGDFKHIFLSHIHFDHAGAAWAFAETGATIYVHPVGLPHLAAPDKLYNSARMIYGGDMDRLWGPMNPIPEKQLYAPEHGEVIEVGGVQFRAWYTPGHATHHIAWEVRPLALSEYEGAVFTGDVAGVKIGNGPVMPPCPPPDINVEDWQESIRLLKGLPTERLFLTHFGEVSDKALHLDALENRLLSWANWMKPYFEQQTPTEIIVPLFQAFVQDQLIAEGVSEADLPRYEAANPAFMSVAGLLRYWKKRPSTVYRPPSTEEIFQQLKNQHIVIIGDVMIDRYLTGSVSRISPEAPVPVVLHAATEDRLGGAANVALNVQALGGIPLLCSVVGHDADGQKLLEAILPGSGISPEGILQSGARCTTLKMRVLGNQQQMLRIDSEDTHDLSASESALLLQKIEMLLNDYPVRAIILQDYNKGVLTSDVIAAVISMAKKRNIFTAVDPKKVNFFAYKGVDLFKPNLKEVRESAPFEVLTNLASLENAAKFLQEKLQNKYTMLTLSEKGLYLKGESAGSLYPTRPRNIADVSGAGDTVISIATMGLAAGLDLQTVALLSNLAGGQVCEYPGVVPVNLQQLEKELKETTRASTQTKST